MSFLKETIKQAKMFQAVYAKPLERGIKANMLLHTQFAELFELCDCEYVGLDEDEAHETLLTMNTLLAENIKHWEDLLEFENSLK